MYFFFFHDPPTTEIYTLSLHDALPILPTRPWASMAARRSRAMFCSFVRVQPSSSDARLAISWVLDSRRSEEHTSELQSQSNLVCRLLLEKKKKKQKHNRQECIDVKQRI